MSKPVLLHFKFDDFANLPFEEDGDATHTDTQTDCNGHEWYLLLYPGGATDNHEPGWVSLYLFSENDFSLDTKFTLSVKDAKGSPVSERKFDCCVFNCNGDCWGDAKIMKRIDILNTTQNILKNGALFIDVEIQVKDCKEHLYQPQSEHSNNLLSLFTTGEKSDSSLHVGDKIFRVHSQIIYANAPLLANCCDGDIHIVDTTPDVFQLILEHIYSGQQPTDKYILKHGKELINNANRYELTQLKMVVENVLVRERIISRENVADYILFADAQSCPLLKEYAISYFLMYHREILKSEHSKCLRDSAELLSEIMLQMNNGNEDDDSESMTVNELRQELGNRKLDVDGSKDALVARLEEAKRQRTE